MLSTVFVHCQRSMFELIEDAVLLVSYCIYKFWSFPLFLLLVKVGFWELFIQNLFGWKM